jgi:hypothetical protein
MPRHVDRNMHFLDNGVKFFLPQYGARRLGLLMASAKCADTIVESCVASACWFVALRSTAAVSLARQPRGRRRQHPDTPELVRAIKLTEHRVFRPTAPLRASTPLPGLSARPRPEPSVLPSVRVLNVGIII